jgi:CcmD family protein
MRSRVSPAVQRWTMALLLALACVAAGAGPARAAQPATPAARDEFVPIAEIPPEDQLPAAPLVIGAYGVAWLVIILYVWSLWRRLARVESELQALTGRLSSAGRLASRER